MATAEKSASPPYVSYKSLNTYFDQRREDGHITDVVDKSLMSNFSGSTQGELLGALKYLKLITPNGEPTEAYRQYVFADEAGRKKLMAEIIRASYPFLFNTTGFNLERATTDQMSKLFQAQGVNGSTLYRGIAFLLAAAKFAEIKVSPNIKVPSNMRTKTKKDNGKSVAAAASIGAQEQEEEEDETTSGRQVFYIPIPIDRRVKIEIPGDWAPSDWDLFSKMLQLYVDGWKQLAAQAKGAKEDGPGAPE